MHDTIVVGARGSPLSLKQVEEIFRELSHHHPLIKYQVLSVTTRGDQDRQTSLRNLDKTDFFTREVDDLLLAGGCHIAIHSAKDLPEPMREGLEVIALTKGVDPSDALVIREGETLREGMRVATSSIRREEAVREICPHAIFCDVRGTIDERLSLLHEKEVDGVVIAEAALIRLGYTHLHRFTLPGETAPLQGKLAIVARTGDTQMKTLFTPLHHD